MNYEELPANRAEAVTNNSKLYFTGIPCKKGHLSPRETKSAHCVTCESIRKSAYRKRNAEKLREYGKDYYQKNRQQHRAAMKAWNERNKDAVKNYNQEWYQKNKDRLREIRREWHNNNPEKRKEYTDRWYENGGRNVKRAYRQANKHRVRAYSNRRRAAETNSIPVWLTDDHLDAIFDIYEEAERLTDETGIEYEVDHIVPLQGKTVCGLHVPWNLRAIPRADNRSKGNKLDETLVLAS